MSEHTKERKVGDVVVDKDGRECLVQLVKDDGKTLGLLTTDSRHAFDAPANSVKDKKDPSRAALRQGVQAAPHPPEENPPDDRPPDDPDGPKVDTTTKPTGPTEPGVPDRGFAGGTDDANATDTSLWGSDVSKSSKRRK